MDALLTYYQTHRLLTLSILLHIVGAVIFYLRRDRRLDSIPGPKGLPLIGMGTKLPPKAPARFRQWALEYGDVFKIRVGWYNWVIINTPEAIREILEKQAVSTSSKAPSPMGHDVVTDDKRMPTMAYGPHWRAQRSIVRQITTVPMSATFVPSQEFETKQLLFDLATNNGPEHRTFYQHMRRYAFSIIMTNTFGARVKTLDNVDAKNAARSQAILREMAKPGAFLVDEFPPLAKLPKWLHPGRARAKAAAKEILDIKMGLWRRVEKAVEAGTAPHCYAREMYENRDSWYSQGLDEADLAWVAGGLVEAGFETSAATLNSLVLHLAAYPRVQAVAQKELMSVVGPDRLPTYADMERLPYVRACVKEMLRINPILAPGIRHYTDADITYKNHVIPQGTVLLANTAFLHHDPSRFERPEEFMPERYLGHDKHSQDYAAMSDPYKRDHFTFSTGRRVCPGARLAENSLDIALAGILWAFEIKPPVIGEGEKGGIEAQMNISDDAFMDAGFMIPKPFAARFIPRSEDRLKVLKAEWERAQREGYELRGVQVDVDGMVHY